MGRLWCMTCGHGIKGTTEEDEGKDCLDCIELHRNPGEIGKMMKPADVEKFVKDRAEATKIARRKTVYRGYKTDEERYNEMKDKIMREIKENFDVTPKNEITEGKRGPGRPKSSGGSELS